MPELFKCVGTQTEEVTTACCIYRPPEWYFWKNTNSCEGTVMLLVYMCLALAWRTKPCLV